MACYIKAKMGWPKTFALSVLYMIDDCLKSDKFHHKYNINYQFYQCPKSCMYYGSRIILYIIKN